MKKKTTKVRRTSKMRSHLLMRPIRILAIAILLVPLANVEVRARSAFFSDYNNIDGIYFIKGSYWFPSPCDRLVFEFKPSTGIWSTYLASPEIGKEEIGTNCWPSIFKVFKANNQLIFRASSSHESQIDGEIFNEYFFDTENKVFGKRKIKIKQTAVNSSIYRVESFEDKQHCFEGDGCDVVSGFSVSNGHGKTSFFPLPRTNTKDFFKWRPQHPQDHFSRIISETIGTNQRVGNRVWFGITFYEGEGWDGVGGIGYFDLATRRYHLSRPKILRDNSVEAMYVDWPYMWLSSGKHYELSGQPATGLLLIDLRTLDSKNPKIDKITLSNIKVEQINLIEEKKPYVWVISASGIHQFNTQDYTWEHFRAKLKIVKDVAPKAYPSSNLNPFPKSKWVFRLPNIPYTFKSDTVLDIYGSDVEAKESNSDSAIPFYEVEGKNAVEGYVGRDFTGGFWCRDIMMSGGYHKDCWMPISLMNPKGQIIGGFKKAPIQVLSTSKDKLMKIKTKSVWIPADSAIPIIEQASLKRE